MATPAALYPWARSPIPRPTTTPLLRPGAIALAISDPIPADLLSATVKAFKRWRRIYWIGR